MSVEDISAAGHKALMQLAWLYVASIASTVLSFVPSEAMILDIVILGSQIAVLAITTRLLKRSDKSEWRYSHFIWINRTLGLGIGVALLLMMGVAVVYIAFNAQEASNPAFLLAVVKWLGNAINFYILLRLVLKMHIASKKQLVPNPKSYGF